jgi:hypothetical protein
MQGLRDEIRAILREELLSLRGERSAIRPETERVRIGSGADLARFAQDLVARAQDADFAARVARGDLVFDLAEGPATPSTVAAARMVTRSGRRPSDRLDKALITERDLAALGPSTCSLRIGASSRLTPLARDEARRRGIRIERDEV